MSQSTDDLGEKPKAYIRSKKENEKGKVYAVIRDLDFSDGVTPLTKEQEKEIKGKIFFHELDSKYGVE